ncbi:MAG: hypothetical protein AAJB65_00305 [Candidatus Hodgkinia cicadicola]
MISGTSVLNVAELSIASGFACFVRRVSLEWFKLISACLNSMLFLKLSSNFMRLFTLNSVYKLFIRGLRIVCALSEHERTAKINTGCYFSAAQFNK